MNSQHLRKRLLEVFPKTKPPRRDDITNHRCEECDELRDGLLGVEWWNFDESLAKRLFGQIPLFTIDAFHYYIPGFMLVLLMDPKKYYWMVRFIVHSLSYVPSQGSREILEQRIPFFSTQQRAVIHDFLQFVSEYDYFDYLDLKQEISAGSEIWKHK